MVKNLTSQMKWKISFKDTNDQSPLKKKLINWNNLVCIKELTIVIINTIDIFVNSTKHSGKKEYQFQKSSSGKTEEEEVNPKSFYESRTACYRHITETLQENYSISLINVDANF